MSDTIAEQPDERTHLEGCGLDTDHEGDCAVPALSAEKEPEKLDSEEILPGTTPLGVTVETDKGPVECRVKRLKAREMLALLRVITRGFGGSIASIMIDAEDPDAMQGQILGLMMVAIPESIDEFVDFVQIIVEPADGSDARRLKKALDNPEPEVVMAVAEIIAFQEKDDLVALVGKARAALARIQSLYKPSA